MRLADYLKKHELSDEQFAERIGRDRSTVSRLRRGLVRPDWSTLDRIMIVTNGAVSADDFLALGRMGSLRSVRAG